MDQMELEIIGAIAGTCTTASFVPQVYHLWKTRSAEDISLYMYLIFITGISTWLYYAYCIKSVSMMVSNSITLILALSIVVMKFMWTKPASTLDTNKFFQQELS